GMGQVFLAQDSKLHRKVAIKLLNPKFANNPEQLSRFIQESEAAAALSHPGVAHIYEVNCVDIVYFIAMDHVVGEKLRQLMSRKSLNLRDALDIATQVAGALVAAHQAGMVHRDIKPENVMLRPDGYIKVLDFGLAKLTERPAPSSDTQAPTFAKVDTDPGTIIGTANYMSPEQARGLTVDARSDIFSLGVVIYEMITGHPPFAGKTTSDLIAAILDKEPPPLARYSRNVPEAMEWIVTKALRKDREERYQNAKELLTDLRRLKQRLEFQAEAERSLSSETSSVSAFSKSGGQAAVATAKEASAQSGEAAARTTSNAEYIVSEIKNHKKSAMLVSAALIIAIAAIVYLSTGSKPLDSLAVLPFVN